MNEEARIESVVTPPVYLTCCPQVEHVDTGRTITHNCCYTALHLDVQAPGHERQERIALREVVLRQNTHMQIHKGDQIVLFSDRTLALQRFTLKGLAVQVWDVIDGVRSVDQVVAAFQDHDEQAVLGVLQVLHRQHLVCVV